MDDPCHNACDPLKSSPCPIAMKWVLYIEQNFKPFNSDVDAPYEWKKSRFRWKTTYKLANKYISFYCILPSPLYFSPSLNISENIQIYKSILFCKLISFHA
mgnify:CR=1 FL=1